MSEKSSRPLVLLSLCAGLAALALPAQAAFTYTYTFDGVLNTSSGAVAYQGSFDATLTRTTVAPAGVATPPLPWQGTLDFYAGAGNFKLIFADTTQLSARTMDLVAVNTTNYTGAGYPDGYSAQIYMNDGSFAVLGPTNKVCSAYDATPCGPNDDPLYASTLSSELARINGAYFYFAQMPGAAVLPDSTQALVGAQMGIGFYSPNIYGYTTTTVSSLTGLTATFTGTPDPVAAVPEPATAALMLGGLALLALYRRPRSS